MNEEKNTETTFDIEEAEKILQEGEELTAESEFEKELDNYLPTTENTDKVKKPLPQWLISAFASALTCIVLFVLYSGIVVPKIKPSAVISYVDRPLGEITEETDTATLNTSVADSIVLIETKTSYNSFFGISTSQNAGSGVVLSSDGYILTSSSLVGNDGETTAILPDKTRHSAKLVGADEGKDIAILKIEATGLAAAYLGNSDNVKQGDTVVFMGNILGEELGASMTRGIISGINSGIALRGGGSINLLQTDAIVGSNKAGGCLINTNGEIIGMVTEAISAESENISFAIPSNDIKNISEAIINTGEAPKGLVVGITGSDTGHGVLVETVIEDTPAQKAGIKANDLILKVDDTAVKSIAEINKIRDSHKKGDTLKITVYRDGEMIDINVTL